MKKIIYFAPANSVHSYRWIYFLKNQYNIEVFWISFHEIEKKFSEEYKGFEFLVLNNEHKLINSKNPINKIKGIIQSKNKINKIFFESNFDFVHVQSFGKYGIVSSFLNSKIKYIGTAWGSDIIFSGKGIRYYLLKKSLKRAEYVTCDADHMIERLNNISKKIKVKLINFGVEMELYNVKKESSKDFVILSLRNHYPVYDIETLIDAFSIFSLNKSVKLNIAGFGDLTDYYKKIVKRKKIESKVIFSGKYNRNSLLKLLSKTNLYISTSKSDAGIAASTAEVMACKIPVLISDSGENKLWINDSQNGFTFITSDIKNLVKKFEYIFNLEKNKLRKISNEGYKTILERNNLKVEMHKLYKLYKEI